MDACEESLITTCCRDRYIGTVILCQSTVFVLPRTQREVGMINDEAGIRALLMYGIWNH